MAYEVYCRQCSWTVAEPVDLKGEANWLAGRHISDTGHSVAIRETEEPSESDPGSEFVRGSPGAGEIEIVEPPRAVAEPTD